jgi:hypothetical protein
VQHIINLGEYMNFGQTVQHFGGFGWPPVVEGTKKVFMEAAKLGGIWCKMDDASALMICLAMRQQHVDIFEQKWSWLLQ